MGVASSTDEFDLSLYVGNTSSKPNEKLVQSEIPSYYIDKASRIDFKESSIELLSSSVEGASPEESLETKKDWLPAGQIVVGVSFDESTPDIEVGDAIQYVITSHNKNQQKRKNVPQKPELED